MCMSVMKHEGFVAPGVFYKEQEFVYRRIYLGHIQSKSVIWLIIHFLFVVFIKKKSADL